jgi:hypothetical protein
MVNRVKGGLIWWLGTVFGVPLVLPSLLIEVIQSPFGLAYLKTLLVLFDENCVTDGAPTNGLACFWMLHLKGSIPGIDTLDFFFGNGLLSFTGGKHQ